MNVKELIEELQKHSLDMIVYRHDSDQGDDELMDVSPEEREIWTKNGNATITVLILD